VGRNLIVSSVIYVYVAGKKERLQEPTGIQLVLLTWQFGITTKMQATDPKEVLKKYKTDDHCWPP
jgi:hypothetical protein